MTDNAAGFIFCHCLIALEELIKTGSTIVSGAIHMEYLQSHQMILLWATICISKSKEWFCEEAVILKTRLAREGLHIVLCLNETLTTETMADSHQIFPNSLQESHFVKCNK